MVSLIKNQLLKHLSIYTKNLSSDKINLSTFRGEGELSNLQLDEAVLTELLELPSWLRLTSAWCNHVSFRISWTKLKSVPIYLTLDEVNITVETCDPISRLQDAKSPNGGGSTGSGGGNLPQVPQGKYSFIHKVIDGITITVNTVNVKFLSAAFTASVQMSRIRVESKTPKWANGDLRVTRLKDPYKGIILIFKELSWQTVRIEASSTQDKSLTPLRLLTNQARCRITIRKRLSDCTLLASRLVLILDDLLWVLTDSQLKAALHFVDSLSGLIKAATHATQKSSAARKLETLPEYQAQLAQQQSRQSDGTHMTSNTQRMFNAFDVRETSYHFFSQRIDLHLCDDEGDGRSSYPELIKGGALQISVQAFQVDYYPYHLAKSDRSHWAKYREASVSPALWLKESLNTFREAVLNLCQPNRPSSHAPLERSTPNSPLTLNAAMLNTQFSTAGTPTIHRQSHGSSTGSNTPTQTPGSAGSAHSSANGYGMQSNQQKSILDNLAKLMSSCVILRVEDFQLFRVTTAGRKQMPKEFISGDKDRYSFPADMPILHAEFTYFYYPGDFIFPLPPSKIFVHINPLQIHFDLSSILWLNSFGLNLHESLMRTAHVGSPVSNPTSRASPLSTIGSQSTTLKGSSKIALYPAEVPSEPNYMYMDVKVEAIMPRIVIESTVDMPHQKDRPRMMQIQISRFALTNIRETGSSRADLAQALHSLQEGSLVFGNGFPSAKNDMCIVTDRILSHVAATDVAATNGLMPDGTEGVGLTDASVRNSIPKSASTQCLTRYAMWSEPRDVWCIKLDPVWIDFLGARSLSANKAIPFIDAVPITLWLHSGTGTTGSESSQSVGGSVCHKDGGDDGGSDTLLFTAKGPSVEANNKNKLPRNPFLDSEEDIYFERKSQTSSEHNERTADLHAIAHISNLISLQIDHYQYLFLLRLAEELNEMTTFLSIDAERILHKHNNKKSLIFGCVIPQVEITFVMPSPTPGKESSGGDAESVLPDSASLGDDLHINSANIVWPTPPSLDPVKNSIFGSVETPSPITNEAPPYDSVIHISNPNTHGHNVHIQNTTVVSSSYMNQTSTRADTGVHTQSTTSSSTKSYRSTRNSTSDATSLTKEINSGLMSMKKGFSSFMTSIDSAITSRTTINDDVSDTFSIQSDISSDSENFAIVMGDDKTMDCIDVMFRLNPFNNESNIKVSPVEVASEVYEEPACKTNLSSPSEPSEASTWRRRDLVSMATFRLTTVELIQQNEGNNSTLRVQVAAISCDECGAIPWDELQNALQAKKTKFGARCKAWNLAPYNPEAPPCLRLRLEETLKPPPKENNGHVIDKKSIESWLTQNADMRINDVCLIVNMSTIIGLADLAEDEIIASNILPLNITLENVRINLIEDRPPVNITSPGPVPLNLAIGRMHVKRDKNGILHIQPIETNLNEMAASSYPLTAALFKQPDTIQRERERDRELLSLQLIMQQIKLENDNLRKQLQNAKDNSENYRQKTKQESDTLRSYLKAAQDEINMLVEENKALVDNIRSLKSEVNTQHGTKAPRDYFECDKEN
ncbi:UHRF1-binding protein 1-like isoform X4 [Glossina fuscipes]|uniref:UHRF1-binding protein 1-like isoform X4 n=1 Tax=Glossina fuscipes TaxID=7396 RepID=A0A8U0WBG4_9MUSC|nr:UHRF1-binding protein 1-like isoform X4 [Glossina fuscipes]